MSPHLADSIRAAFPHLCADYGKPDTETGTSMRAGFAIHDGWAQLFCQLMSELEAQRRALPPDEAARVKLAQVKEKFGGLRVYLEHRTDALYAACERAEEESFHICERCGTGGERVYGGWIRTLCPACAG
jgi:hypothetical protein